MDKITTKRLFGDMLNRPRFQLVLDVDAHDLTDLDIADALRGVADELEAAFGRGVNLAAGPVTDGPVKVGAYAFCAGKLKKELAP